MAYGRQTSCFESYFKKFPLILTSKWAKCIKETFILLNSEQTDVVLYYNRDPNILCLKCPLEWKTIIEQEKLKTKINSRYLPTKQISLNYYISSSVYRVRMLVFYKRSFLINPTIVVNIHKPCASFIWPYSRYYVYIFIIKTSFPKDLFLHIILIIQNQLFFCLRIQ